MVQTPENMKVVVSKDGPYIVTGGVPLDMQIIEPNEDGLSWNWNRAKSFNKKGEYHLCRCGQSRNKPFCDDSHLKTKFDGKETASRKPFLRAAEVWDGPGLLLRDQEDLCAFARFCDPGGKIWALMENTDDPKTRKLAVREANHCPSGRLVVYDKKDGRPIEEEQPPSISVVEDPALGCSGPLWVRGGIRVESGNGTPYEVRDRVTLCRCGASVNKPFCNGSHASIQFRDGLVEFVKLKKR